jgi:pyrimidine operon attenuation protein/uracil phosphoribosyltransferase
MEERTLLLNARQIDQRVNRIAYQIYEDNINEKEIVVAGIMKNGYRVAEKIAEVIRNISPLLVTMAEVHIDKHSQSGKEISLSLPKNSLAGKSVTLVDDVLNSGKTIMYALKPFLESDIKKIRTAVLIDRNHKRFPVAADFTGLSLSTTLHEHIAVEFDGNIPTAWLG